ncbi:hypothetical protein CYMTET_27869, partial [Cymbomonas tetramitiformis]
MVAIAKKATSADRLAQDLVAQGLPSGSQTRTFASELLSRVPRAKKEASKYKQEERQATTAALKNMQYQMLEPDEEELAMDAKAQRKQERKEKRVRKRERAAALSSDEDEEAVNVRKKAIGRKGKAKWEEDDEDDEEAQKDRQRKADQLEKEEFEERLRAKDDEKTVKVTDKMTKAQQEEAAKRTFSSKEEQEAMMPDLREFSRQEYLKKRQKQQMQSL